jgi:hypothetical protein
MKLPAYVNVESKPYEPDLYRAGLDGPEIDGKENPVAARAKMIGVRNTIRWKWVTGADGEPVSGTIRGSGVILGTMVHSAIMSSARGRSRVVLIRGRSARAMRGCCDGRTVRCLSNWDQTSSTSLPLTVLPLLGLRTLSPRT